MENMSKRSDALPASVIAADMEVVGDIISKGALAVDGRIEGRALAVELSVADGAVLKGEFKAEVASISGEIIGKIHSRIVRLSATAKIDGIIEQSVLHIAEGAEIEGTVVRLKDNAGPEGNSPSDLV